MAAAVDAQQYAEALRRSLMEDILSGQDLGDPADVGVDDQGYADPSQVAAEQLRDLDQELEQFSGHEAIRSILEKGVVVQEYARDVDDRLRAVELESIQDYIQESDNLVALHDQIKSCDGILAHMEELLGKFQTDLGQVSDEIRQLQVQSQTMSTKLKNRRAAENRLGAFVEQMAVSEDLISSVLDAEVSEDYLEQLLLLDRKIQYVTSDDSARSSQCRRDIEPVLEKLRVKAITKVRDFLFSKLHQLRKPKTNISIIQQTVLLKYKYFVRFLRDHGKDVYDELHAEYVSLMSRVYAAHFRTYLGAMEKMQVSLAGPQDLLGSADSAVGAGVASMMALFGKQQGKPAAESVLALGERGSVLAQVEQPAIIPHMAEFEGKRFPYEVVFRNVHKLLVDTASSEYLFCLDFWEDEGTFTQLAAPFIQVVEGDLTTAVPEQHDILCVLLMIRINAEHRRLMAKRRVPCLDDYLDRINLLLWPRFKVLFDAHLGSIKAGAERALFNSEPGVHYVTRRYAALSASMLALMANQELDDGVFQASSFYELLERLWVSIFDTLLRMSNMFKDRRQGIIFLILNYNHIKVTWRTADSQRLGAPSAATTAAHPAAAAATAAGKGPEQPSSPTATAGALGVAGANALKECEDQLASCTSLYVEDQLAQHVKELVEFVKKAEQTQKRAAIPDGQPIPGYGAQEAAPVLRGFSLKWKSAIEMVTGEVTKQIVDPVCAREVLQASMTQLLLYYTRMLELLKKQGPEGVAAAREAVNIPAIMYEIKRMTKA